MRRKMESAAQRIKKIGVLHDPSPYANAQKAAAEKEAKDYGLEIVGVEQYKTDDADLSVQIQKMYAAGARAIIKIGLGGTTLRFLRHRENPFRFSLCDLILEDLRSAKPEINGCSVPIACCVGMLATKPHTIICWKAPRSQIRDDERGRGRRHGHQLRRCRAEQGILPTKSEIITGRGFRYTQSSQGRCRTVASSNLQF